VQGPTQKKLKLEGATMMMMMISTSRGSKWIINVRTLLVLLVPIVMVHVHLYTKLFSHVLYNNNNNNEYDANNNEYSAALLRSKIKIKQLHQGRMVDDDITSRNLNNHTTTANTHAIAVPPKQQQQSSSISQPYRKWAYVYLMGGCNSDKPYYRGYLYNILVSAYILQDAGTKADIVVMVQMSSKVDPAHARLPLEDTQLLDKMGIVLVYLPQPTPDQESFYHLQLAKFHVLRLTQYSRVFFLDADVMPFCNVDYMFELSEPKRLDQEEKENSHSDATTNSQQSLPPRPPPSSSSSSSSSVRLKENIILAYKTVPAAGSYFILKPGPDEYDEITAIIRRREEEAPTLPYPHFDDVQGWGHVITPPGTF
jgi:alpha-N-acetylglucosamine transferase